MATQSREGRARGGVILRRGVCACTCVVERVRVRVRMGCELEVEPEADVDVDAYGGERVDGEDEGFGNDAPRCASMD